MLGALLLVHEKLGREARIVFRREAARARAGDGPHGHAPAGDAHEQLGRAANELEPIEHEMVHVRRRIQRAQRAIERGGVEVQRNLDASCEECLEAVAGEDVFAYPLDVRSKLAREYSKVPVAGARGAIEIERREIPRRAQARDRRIDVAQRVVVRATKLGVRRARAHGHAHHHARLRA